MNTLKSMRLHIGIFGRTNVGKSSIINKITNQQTSIVSEKRGTTTDIVEKSMELLPIGPVNILDTAGIDDDTEIGRIRIEKTFQAMERIDVGVIVSDYNGIKNFENLIITKFKELNIPYFVIINKTDIKLPTEKLDAIYTSALTDDDIVYKFKSAIIKLLPQEYIETPKIAGDLIPERSTVIMVIPIDKEAPKGRIILPQVQTLRDLLDSGCKVLSIRDTELKEALEELKNPPALVITDSQAFRNVSEIVPANIPLTSFSILFARLKGNLNSFVEGAKAIDKLQDEDKVLILESCTHHAIEDDIGRVKIPNLLRKKTGKKLIIENFSGHDFPDVSGYKLIVHCGGCMINAREMHYRLEILSRIIKAHNAKVPITNYGITISYCLGILDRAVKIFNI